MDLKELAAAATGFLRDSPLNFIQPGEALRAELAGMRIYDEPLLAVGAADDPLFRELRQPGALHPEALLPGDWLPGARSVVSVFCPYSRQVRRGALRDGGQPSDEWLHGRIEGQRASAALGAYLTERLTGAGYETVQPTADPRFGRVAKNVTNWSERHVAFICGLGTFGLSRSIITAAGSAGRLVSVVTACPMEPTPRAYTGRYDYCIRCGKCQTNCPASAIDQSRGLDGGKDNALCAAFLKTTYQPPWGPEGLVRYGCGRCQMLVPCETEIPPAARRQSI